MSASGSSGSATSARRWRCGSLGRARRARGVRRRAEPVAGLVAAGREDGGRRVAVAGRRGDVLSVMVRDDDQVRDVVGQAIGTARPGSVIVVHSTIEPETPRPARVTASRPTCSSSTPRSAAARWAPSTGRSRSWSAAPRRRTPPAKPFWRGSPTKVVHVGPIGAGTQVKLARNLMHFTAFTAATEAQRLAEAAGLDLVELGDVVRHTDAVTGGPGAIMLRDTTAPLAEDDFWHGVVRRTSSRWGRRTSGSPSSSRTSWVSTYRSRARRRSGWRRGWDSDG